MVENIQIAAFEGGQLLVTSTGEKSHEAVLALPLDRLLLKLIKIPVENATDMVAYATPFVQELSPYPDVPLTVSCEVLRETSDGLIVLAAALPENATDDIANALDDAKLNITRVDALALGRLHSLWQELSDGKTGVRRLLLMKSVDCISLFILDDDLPIAIRAITSEGDLRREIMLSLLEAEDFGEAKSLDEVVLVGDFEDEELLSSFAPVRKISELEKNTSIDGVIFRSQDPALLNVIPASWQAVLEETRFKNKLKRFLLIAGVIWALIMATLIGVPIVYGFMTDHQKALSKEHSRRYKEVKEMREKVRLVQKYSDHARGSLEILKAVSDRLPEGVELNSWSFRRDDGVKFSGESADAASVYKLKDRLLETKMMSEDGEEEALFPVVELTGPSAGRGGKQRFDIDCKFNKEEQ